MMNKGGNVLLIAPNSSTDSPLPTLVRQAGYTVRVTHRLREATALLEDERYDALVVRSDTGSPDAFDPTRLSDADGVRVSCVWITATPNLEAAIHAANAGLFAYLPEPVAPDTLHARLREAVARTRIERLAHGAEQRSMQITERIEHIRSAARDASTSPSEAVLESFFELIFERVADAYIDARQLLFILSRRHPTALERSLRHDPVRRRLTEALEEAVHVIESTKHQFKSKRLGRLRQELEAVLKEASH